MYTFKINKRKCIGCNFCKEVLFCPNPSSCIGCKICFYGCPYDARKSVKDRTKMVLIPIKVNRETFMVPNRITVKKALEFLGFFKNRIDFCSTGGCYNCIVKINGDYLRSCVTEVEKDMDVLTHISSGHVPRRIIFGPEPHPVGAKGTPWKESTYGKLIEMFIWTAGCNLKCPQCQTFSMVYNGLSKPMFAYDAAKAVTRKNKLFGLKRITISGGEPTLNRRWLTSYFKELKKLNNKDIQFHLDSNGTLLTYDYIDELINDCRLTNIGIEPKCVSVKTFLKITGIDDERLAKNYLETSWNAIRYMVSRYKERIFLGVGMIYNKALISLDEVYEFGKKLSFIDPSIQLCVPGYFPAFKRKTLKIPFPEEMKRVKRILEEAGLRNVVVQTTRGYIGPS